MNQVDQRFSEFQTVMLQTVKDSFHQLVISTNQNTTNQNQPTSPFTNDHLTSSPTLNQPSTIH